MSFLRRRTFQLGEKSGGIRDSKENDRIQTPATQDNSGDQSSPRKGSVDAFLMNPGNSKNANGGKGKTFKIGAPSNYDKLKFVRDKHKKEKDTPQIYEAPDPLCKS